MIAETMCMSDNRSILVLIIAIALLLTGCTRTQQTTYYQLASTADVLTGTSHVDTESIIIGLGPVKLPEILNRQQIVTHSGSNRVELADNHRWAEPLQDNIARVLRNNLSTLLGTEQIIAFPWSRSIRVDYQIRVEIVRFEGQGVTEAQLEAVWSVLNRDGKVILPERRSHHTVKSVTADHDGLVAALGGTLTIYCQEIAVELTNFVKPCP